MGVLFRNSLLVRENDATNGQSVYHDINGLTVEPGCRCVLEVQWETLPIDAFRCRYVLIRVIEKMNA